MVFQRGVDNPVVGLTRLATSVGWRPGSNSSKFQLGFQDLIRTVLVRMWKEHDRHTPPLLIFQDRVIDENRRTTVVDRARASCFPSAWAYCSWPGYPLLWPFTRSGWWKRSLASWSASKTISLYFFKQFSSWVILSLGDLAQRLRSLTFGNW